MNFFDSPNSFLRERDLKGNTDIRTQYTQRTTQLWYRIGQNLGLSLILTT